MSNENDSTGRVGPLNLTEDETDALLRYLAGELESDAITERDKELLESVYSKANQSRKTGNKQ